MGMQQWTGRLLVTVSLIVGAVGGNAFAGTMYWDGDGAGASGNPPTSEVGGGGTWNQTAGADGHAQALRPAEVDGQVVGSPWFSRMDDNRLKLVH